MAVFQAARLRSTALPAASVSGPAVRPRASATAAVRATHSVRPVGLLLAGILVATMLGLAYLTQTLGTNATSSQVDQLQAESVTLQATLRNQSFQLAELTEVDLIRASAQRQGLRSLGKPTVLQAP
jgi:hypothetical protein